MRYIQAVEVLLQQEQVNAMETIARASAVLVAQYPKQLLARNAVHEKKSDYVKVLSATNDFQIDGYQDDWLEYFPLLKTISTENQLLMGESVDPQDLSVRYLMAKQDRFLAVFLDVVDDSIQFRDQYKQKRHDSDAIIIASIDNEKRVHRYILSSSSFGALNAYEFLGSYLEPLIVQRYTGIKAEWKESSYGYRVELMLPLNMMQSSLAFSVIDFDKNESEPKVLGLADVRNSALFSTLLLPSEPLSQLLSEMATEGVRLWLVDNQSQLLAFAGQGEVLMEETKFNSIIDLFYQLFLTPVASDDESLSHEQAVISGDAVKSALKGIAQTERRQADDVAGVTIVASEPIFVDGLIVGAIIAEKNTNAILGLQNKAVKSLLNMTLLVFVVVVAVLIGFASRLSFRIRRLNRDVSSVVNGDGRLAETFSQRIEYDELGELRQGFEQLFERLSTYTNYLEALSSRLAHELRTPIAVIRTSLEHLEQSPADKQIYIDRARTGSERLNSIVARMSEASRLEQTVVNVELTEFDLQQLLTNLLPIYNDLYPTVTLHLEAEHESVIILGSEDLIVQMLDKLISNAVDFHLLGSPIILGLRVEGVSCFLIVKNTGISLPEGMALQLFQPMVSIRQSMSQSDNPHLGLGLYMVKLVAKVHGGEVTTRNWQQGVEFSIELPTTVR